MQTITRSYIPLLRKSEWPKVNMPKAKIKGLVEAFGDTLEVYRRAVSATYVTALSFDQRHQRLPDDSLEGRDPRW